MHILQSINKENCIIYNTGKTFGFIKIIYIYIYIYIYMCVCVVVVDKIREFCVCLYVRARCEN